MKKLFALLLAVFIALPSFALADDVLVNGWQNASLDELEDAEALLKEKIIQLRTNAVTEKPATFSGSGVTITDGFTLASGIWCRKVTYSDLSYSLSPKLMESINGEENKIYLVRPEIEVFQCAGDTIFDYLAVDIDCDWTIEYIPLDYQGDMELSGNTSIVSCFTCTRPTIVSFTASRHGMDRGYYGLDLYSIDKNGKLKSVDCAASGNLEEGESITTNAIVNPSEDTCYFVWQLVCDAGVEWSITEK